MFDNTYGYDEECYPNAFLVGFAHMGDGHRYIFEISERLNQSIQLFEFVNSLCINGTEGLGFNNEGYDYPNMHFIMERIAAVGHVTPYEIYQKSSAIIDAPFGDWTHSVPPWKRMFPQIDVYKVMHFDNQARRTSLKALQFAMRSESVQDLPIKPGTVLTHEQIDQLIGYMCHDISETIRFAWEIKDEIAFRRQLTAETGIDMINFNDTKIGKQTFIRALENSGVACFEKINGRKTPIQTRRPEGIRVADTLLPVQFKTPEFQRIRDFFAKSIIPADETKGFFTDLSVEFGGIEFVFGSGGLHASVEKLRFQENDEYEIIDIDVESYYPSLAIVNRWFPFHLGERFCEIYADLKRQRVSHAKGTPQNKSLKLALNGVYGDSNNQHSPFYDPAYTMAITINGQMLLAYLAENIITELDDVKLIQVNTDGITLWAHRSKRPAIMAICKWWEAVTQLKLEYANYQMMAIRDVNNYIAVDDKGKVKRKNAYLTEHPMKRNPIGWHQDLSSLVIPKAANEALINGTNIQDFVFNHTDPFDFMRRIKAPKKHRVYIGDDQVQNMTRYFVSLTGGHLTKVMPPLAGKTAERTSAVDKGWLVTDCNRAADFDWHNLNRRFYVNEAKKLVDCINDFD